MTYEAYEAITSGHAPTSTSLNSGISPGWPWNIRRVTRNCGSFTCCRGQSKFLPSVKCCSVRGKFTVSWVSPGSAGTAMAGCWCLVACIPKVDETLPYECCVSIPIISVHDLLCPCLLRKKPPLPDVLAKHHWWWEHNAGRKPHLVIWGWIKTYEIPNLGRDESGWTFELFSYIPAISAKKRGESIAELKVRAEAPGVGQSSGPRPRCAAWEKSPGAQRPLRSATKNWEFSEKTPANSRWKRQENVWFFQEHWLWFSNRCVFESECWRLCQQHMMFHQQISFNLAFQFGLLGSPWRF